MLTCCGHKANLEEREKVLEEEEEEEPVRLVLQCVVDGVDLLDISLFAKNQFDHFGCQFGQFNQRFPVFSNFFRNSDS
jgi:hypothetical protein